MKFTTQMGRTAAAVRPLIFALFAGAFAFTVGIAGAQQSFTPREEEPEEFPDAPGRDETFYFCTACHNFKLVAQQGMSRPRWDGTLDWMTERHGMPKLEGKDREIILNYLTRAFPETTPADRGWQNPFLKN